MTRWSALLAAASVGLLTMPAGEGARRLRRLFAADRTAGRPYVPARKGVVVVVVAAAVLLVVQSGALAAGLLVLVAAVAGRRVIGRRRLFVSRGRERARALEALAMLSGDLRAGRSPADALAVAAQAAVGATSKAFAAAASAARLGGDVPAALQAQAQLEPSAVPEVLRGLAACWAVCSVTGSGLSTGVQRLEEGLRAAEGQRRAVAAELAGPRATAALLAALPVAGIALAAALGADPLRILLGTPAGVVCLLLGLSLDALGLLWANRLVARALTA